MSNYDRPFEFSYKDTDGYLNTEATPELGKLIDTWAIETYGNEFVVTGVIAFDDDKNLLAIRVQNYATADGESHITDDSGDAWDNMVTWLRDLGSSHVFSFTRRPETFGLAVIPTMADIGMLMTSTTLAVEDRLNYHGHVITAASGDVTLLSAEATSVHEHLGCESADEVREVKATLLAAYPALNPTIVKALDAAVAHFESGLLDMSDEEVELFTAATDEVAKLLATLDNSGPLTPKGRPEIPSAFYNN